MFRYERPQKGRYRQFHQIGAELIGPSEPLADAEVIACGWDILSRLGIAGDTVLEVNTLGDRASRDAYRAALVDYFSARRGGLSAESRDRLERNPMRILDSKDAADRAIVADAPTIAPHLTPEAAGFYADLLEHLNRFGVPFRENPRIVRGLDYYNHTAFEFVTDRLGAQGTVMAGGRYDGLVEQMGGPPTPAVGWAAGIERLSMLLADAVAAPASIAIIPVGEGAEPAATTVLQMLRRAGVRAEMAYRGNLKRRMERANRIGARAARDPGIGRSGTGCRPAQAAGHRCAGGGGDRQPRRPARVSSLDVKLDRVVDRAEELRAQLTAGLSGDSFARSSRELSELEPIVARIGDLRAAERSAREAEALLADPEMKGLAEAELLDLRGRLPDLQREIRLALLPRDAADERSAILEVRPAAGGDEAGLFAAELFGMYQRYAGVRGWRFELMDYAESELGGLKEGVAEISGRGVFARLKYEIRRPPGPAGADDRKPGTHPHLDGYRRRAARSGGGGRPGQRVGSAHRHVPRLRRRRAAHQQDRQRGAYHPHPVRRGGGDAGRAVAAQEPRQGDEGAACPAVRAATLQPLRCPWSGPQGPGRYGGPIRAHPHV